MVTLIILRKEASSWTGGIGTCTGPKLELRRWPVHY